MSPKWVANTCANHTMVQTYQQRQMCVRNGHLQFKCEDSWVFGMLSHLLGVPWRSKMTMHKTEHDEE